MTLRHVDLAQRHAPGNLGEGDSSWQLTGKSLDRHTVRTVNF